MKRFLVALTFLLMAALLVGCSSTAAPSPTAAPAPTAAASAPTAAAPAPTAAAPAPTTAAAPKPATGEPIIIGCATAETGFLASFDTPAVRTLQFAVDDINAKGGVMGRPLKVVTADSKSDVSVAGQAALDVIGKGANIVMVTTDFDMGSPATRVANSKGLLGASFGAGSAKFAVPGSAGPWAYSFGAMSPIEGYTLAEFAYKEKGWRKAWTLTDETADFHKKISASFETRFTELGGKIVGKDTFLNSDASIGPQVTRLKGLSETPDFVAVYAHPPGLGSALRQIRAAGVDLPILGHAAYGGTYWLDAVPNLKNVWHSALAATAGDDPRPEVKALAERYIKQFGQPADKDTFLSGYVAMQVLAEAIRVSGGKLDGASLNTAMESITDFPTLAGPYTFTPKLHMSPIVPMTIEQIQDGKWVTIQKVFTPEKSPDPYQWIE